MMFRVEDTQIELYAHEESNNMAGKVAQVRAATMQCHRRHHTRSGLLSGPGKPGY